MQIINKTKSKLFISGGISIEAGKSAKVNENIFDTKIIYSDEGTCKITTEYCQRSFKSFGNLTAHEEGEGHGPNKLKDIIVTNNE